MLLQLDAFHARRGEIGPAIAGGNALLLAEELGALVGHLEEEEEGELFEIVLIREPIVTQDVAVGPQLLDDAVGDVAHWILKDSYAISNSTRRRSATGTRRFTSRISIPTTSSLAL